MAHRNKQQLGSDYEDMLTARQTKEPNRKSQGYLHKGKRIYARKQPLILKLECNILCLISFHKNSSGLLTIEAIQHDLVEQKLNTYCFDILNL